MGDQGDYSVDSEELMDIVRELRECKQVLDRNLSDLRRQMKVLHGTWDGLAAQAHTEAEEEMEQGLDGMNLALQDLIEAKETAHGNYTAAWDANVSMWKSVQ